MIEFRLDTESQKLACISEVTQAPLGQDWFVTIETRKKNRSKAQNRLLWMWLTDFDRTDINEHAGHSQDWWHDFFKRNKLSKIFERDNEGYAQTIANIREVYRHGMHTHALNMMDFVIKETHTYDANVPQFAEYLDYIEKYAHKRGIALRTDNETYREAMGR